MSENIKHFDNMLQNTIDCLAGGRGIHISVHKINQIFEAEPALNIEGLTRFHSKPFCVTAKNSKRGKSTCMKIKELAIGKALREKSLYVGRCHLGITEIVKPVYVNDIPICVLFLGHLMLEDDKEKNIKRINRVASNTGINKFQLLYEYQNVRIIKKSELKFFIKLIEHLAKVVELYIASSSSIVKSVIDGSAEKENWVIVQVTQYIKEYYSMDLSLERIAKLYFINPQYLSRLFKKVVGVNFSKYLCDIRLKHAKALLRKTNMKIVDIAMETGFNSSGYFNTIFKKQTGYTPLEYRNRSD